MSSGRDVIVAFKKASTWGTAVSVNSSNLGVLVSGASGFHAIPELVPDPSAGFAFHEYIEHGALNVAPSLTLPLRYDGQLWALVAAFMGDDSFTDSAPEYYHSMDLQQESAYFGTLCLYDGVTVREIPSFQVTGIVIRGSSGGFLEMEVSGIGNDVLYTGQTNSTLASVTYRTKEQRIPFGACTIMMNDQSSGALSSSTDKICPVSFELSIQRQMEQDFTACGNTYTQAGITQQPVDNGHIETTLTLELPEYTADDWLDDLDAGTVRKAQLTVTGDVITNFNRELDIYLPGLVPADAVADINGADRISNSLTFQAVKAQSNPTGMTTTVPRIYLINVDSADYLA